MSFAPFCGHRNPTLNQISFDLKKPNVVLALIVDNIFAAKSRRIRKTSYGFKGTSDYERRGRALPTLQEMTQGPLTVIAGRSPELCLKTLRLRRL